MWDLASGPKLTQEEFENLRNLIKDNCGIYFDENSKYILEKRLGSRIKELKFQSCREYVFYLKYDKKREEEFIFIYDTLTTNETYFFREEYQLKAFIEEIIFDVIKYKENDRTIRIWSAGCSTGEEPYTIAMLLSSNKNIIEGFKINIFGSDISHRCLKIAREAVYNPNSFRTTTEENKRKFFEPAGDGKFRVTPNIREMVNFGHLNLMDRNKMGMLPTMDIVFCRNVLIYFDTPSRKIVIENFYDKLQKNGFLLLGHAESLINISTSFIIKHCKNDMVYQKP
jgi:chemotaxis protein methyltransferase CheR